MKTNEELLAIIENDSTGKRRRKKTLIRLIKRLGGKPFNHILKKEHTVNEASSMHWNYVEEAHYGFVHSSEGDYKSSNEPLFPPEWAERLYRKLEQFSD